MNLTAAQLAAQFNRAADDAHDAVQKVVEAAAYRIRGAAYDAVSAAGSGNPNDRYRYAARQIEAVPDGPLGMAIGYDNQIEPLAAAIEYGSATISPGGHLANALETEAPRFEQVVPLAAMKGMR